MTAPAPSRARRLLRWYPLGWRNRYGEEFSELLVADIEERPRSLRRTADLARSGLSARLREAQPAPVAVGATAVFLATGLAMWSQVDIGWHWSRPDGITEAAWLGMSGAALVLAAMAALALPRLMGKLMQAVTLRGRGLRMPLLLAIAAGSVLVAGGRHFANGWPGTGGHPWNGDRVMPAGVAAFIWATTRWVSAYWAHPAALLRFPAMEIGWMALSPVATACFVAGVGMTLGRLGPSRPLRRWEAWLGRVAAAAMGAFLAAAGCWVVSGLQGGFHPGVVDAACLVVMTVALTVGMLARRRQPPSWLPQP